MGGRGGNSGMGRGLAPEEIEALQFYSDGNGRDMNFFLRTGNDSSDVYGPDYGDDIAEYTEVVANILQGSSLPQSMTGG